MTRIYTFPRPWELAHRQADGIDVRLHWHGEGNVLSVVVDDTRTGASFELVLG